MVAHRKNVVTPGKPVAMGRLAAAVPRAARGRTGAETTPVFIRGPVSADGTVDRDAVRLALGTTLGHRATRIDRIDVVFRDENGPKGAPTVGVTLEIRLSNAPPLAVSAKARTGAAAFRSAIRAAERMLRRRVEKLRGARGR